MGTEIQLQHDIKHIGRLPDGKGPIEVQKDEQEAENDVNGVRNKCCGVFGLIEEGGHRQEHGENSRDKEKNHALLPKSCALPGIQV